MDVVDYIFQSKNKIVGKGVTKEDIEIEENELNLSFSSEYCKILKEFNFVCIDSHELTGIKFIERLDVSLLTKEHRKYNELVPNDLYVIEELGIDGVVIWQNSKGEIFQTVGISEPVKIANSLYDYLTLL